MKRATITCSAVTKVFRSGDTQTTILQGIDFTAYEGEMIMLMGPSGSGKTTLLSIIGGILDQSSGECLVLNTPINALPEEEKTHFRGKNIGFMFQHFNLVPTLNAVENAAIPLLLSGHERKHAFEQAEQLLFACGLDQQRYRKVTYLSGGEQQRVSIARACVHQPKIILCDEPTSSLDHERGKKIMQLLHDIKVKNNCTLIVVTHDPRILPFADRILTMEDGKIEKESKPLQQLV